MRGWVFTFGADVFGKDVAPAHVECVFVFLIFDMAFMSLCDLNSKMELDALMDKHRITDIKDFCSMFCVNKKPPFGFYAIEEIEINF